MSSIRASTSVDEEPKHSNGCISRKGACQHLPAQQQAGGRQAKHAKFGEMIKYDFFASWPLPVLWQTGLGAIKFFVSLGWSLKSQR
jgi:hypothetical protein